MSGSKVLCINNDAFFTQIYADRFCDAGIGFCSACDGESGIRKACVESPSCILLDLFLPGRDGFQILDELRQSPETAHIPVVILTDLAEPEDVERCLAAGACGYAIKAHTRPEQVVRMVIGASK